MLLRAWLIAAAVLPALPATVNTHTPTLMNPMCGYEPAAALGDDGRVLTWGRSHKTASASECCERCMEQAAQKTANGHEDKACNIFVWCPHPTRCWANDIWNHTFGECWLKRQRDPLRTPKYNARGNYAAEHRRQHSTMPPAVHWVSGVIGRSLPGGWDGANEHAASCFGRTCATEFERMRQSAGLPP